MQMSLELLSGNLAPFLKDLLHGRAEPASNGLFVPNRRVD